VNNIFELLLAESIISLPPQGAAGKDFSGKKIHSAGGSTGFIARKRSGYK